MAVPNFGVQEWSGMNDSLREVFPGSPEVEDGYLYPSPGPGLGVDLDEEKAKQYPCRLEPPQWTLARTVDGTAVRP
jgi:mannonate dehydratase